MKLSCLQENLSRGLAIVGRAVASRPTLPVLSHVLLSTQDGQLQLAATDLEQFIVCRIGAKVEEEGEITVPARLFVDLVNSLPAERIELSLDEQTLHLQCAKNEADIKGIDAQEFPLLPNEGQEYQIWLDPALLRPGRFDRHITVDRPNYKGRLAIYELFPILSERRDNPGTALSGGQQQRLGTARRRQLRATGAGRPGAGFRAGHAPAVARITEQLAVAEFVACLRQQALFAVEIILGDFGVTQFSPIVISSVT